MIQSKVRAIGNIVVPTNMIDVQMDMFNIEDATGIVKEMCHGFTGRAFLTITTKQLKEGVTLRRGGAHTDGNYFQHENTLYGHGNGGGGNGWKVGENGPPVGTQEHTRGYLSKTGGIIIASNVSLCKAWNGNYKGVPSVGGDCRHIELDEGFMMSPSTIYYGNSSFIHESLPATKDVLRTMIRVTLDEKHIYA